MTPAPILRTMAAMALATALCAGAAPRAIAHLSIIREGAESRGSIEAGDRFGAALAAGDFNGDGYDDLAMGAPTEDVGGLSNAGAVIVDIGSALGVTHIGAQLLTAATIGQTNIAGAQFGFALAAADFDQDGYDDLLIGAPFAMVSGTSGAGRIYVVYGSAGGLQPSSVTYDESDMGGAIEANDHFGYAFATGDFDGDALGFHDAAVGAPGEDNGAGAVAINLMGGFFGLSTGIASFVKQSTLGGTNDAGDQFGHALAAGNVVGTSYDDLVIGVPHNGGSLFGNLGAIWILRGSASALTTGAALFYDPNNIGSVEAGAEFGYALAVGHFFPGSYQSVAIGEPGRTVSASSDAGRVLAVKGGSSGLDLASLLILTQNIVAPGTVEPNDRFGSTLAAGDFESPDGYDDVAIGSPGDGFGVTTAAGNFHVFFGGPSGPTGAAWAGFNQGTCNEPFEGNDEFGASIAFGRFDATNKGGFAVGAPGEQYEDLISNPNVFLDDAGLVHIIAPWRQAFGLSCLRSTVWDCDNQLVFSQKPFERVRIASTTKTMTLLVAAEHTQLPPNDPEYVDPNTNYIVPSWVANNIGGSQFGLFTAERMMLLDMMYACLYRSGNDAAYAIADLVGDGATAALRIADFIGEMNAKAVSLGMNGTHFNNPPGFEQEAYGDDLGEHWSTPYDMALLSRAALLNPLTRQISSHLSRNIIRHIPWWNSTIDIPWTIMNFFPGMGIQDATGIKGGYTSAAKITGLFSIKPPNTLGDVIATTFTTDTLPKGAYVNNAKALMQLGAAECAPFYIVEGLIPSPSPYRVTWANLSTARDSSGGLSVEVPEGQLGDLHFDVFRQAGTGPANAEVDLLHTSQVDIGPGASAGFGLGLFHRHLGIRILNMDEVPRRIRVTLSSERAPTDYTLGPGEEVAIPPYDVPGTEFTMQIQNLDTSPGAVPLAVEEIYAFDLTGLPDPTGPPAFTARLMRNGMLSNEGVALVYRGLDPQAGSLLFLALHEEGTTVDVGRFPGPGASGRMLRLLPPAPNPFAAQTRIQFELIVAANVRAAIYDVQGRRVRKLPETRFAPGPGSVEWDGRNNAGTVVRPGLYFYRVFLDGREAARGRVVVAR